MANLRTKGIKGLEIKAPPGGAFAYETDRDLPKLHQVNICCGVRGSGKSTAVVNLLEMLPFHRIIAVSPSMLSNKELMDRLNVKAEDVFDPDDPDAVKKIRHIIDEERDEWEDYLRAKERYNKLKSDVHKQLPVFQLDEDAISEFYDGKGGFREPRSKYGSQPCVAILFDDILGAKVMRTEALTRLCIFHRHIGELSQGGALGCSLFFLVQSYKCIVGGLNKTIRNQATTIILFKTKNMDELEEIAKECSGEVGLGTFFKVYERAIREKFDFLFIDLHRKDEHPSPFRRNFNEFILLPEEELTDAVNLPARLKNIDELQDDRYAAPEDSSRRGRAARSAGR